MTRLDRATEFARAIAERRSEDVEGAVEILDITLLRRGFDLEGFEDRKLLKAVALALAFVEEVGTVFRGEITLDPREVELLQMVLVKMGRGS